MRKKERKKFLKDSKVILIAIIAVSYVKKILIFVISNKSFQIEIKERNRKMLINLTNAQRLLFYDASLSRP